MSIRCPNCGKDNLENALFCNYCGFKLVNYYNNQSNLNSYQTNSEKIDYSKDFEETNREYNGDFRINNNSYDYDFKVSNNNYDNDFKYNNTNYSNDFEKTEKDYNNDFETDHINKNESADKYKDYSDDFKDTDKSNENINNNSKKISKDAVVVEDNLPSKIIGIAVQSHTFHLLVFDLILFLFGQFWLSIILLGIIIFDYYNQK